MPAPAITVGAVLFVLFNIFYWDSLSNLLRLWNTDITFSHGFLIPFLSIYLITKKNKYLSHILLKPAPLFLIPLVLILFLWILASITYTLTIELTLLPLIFIFFYASIIGYKASLILATSLLYLLFAVPIWSIIAPFLQSMAIFINEFALQITGIPTHIKNSVVSIPAGTFEIERGCAGIGYLMTTLAIGSFFSLLNFKRIQPTIILLIISLVLSIIFNWIRIYAIILIGHFTDMQSPIIEDHVNFGWYLYAISLIPFFYIANRLAKLEYTEEVEEQANIVITDSFNYSYPKSYILIPLIFLISAPTLITYLTNSKAETLQEILPPNASTPWLGPIYFDDWKPNYTGASIEINRLYIGTDKAPDISLHIFYYGKQTKDSELINELNTVTDNYMIKSQRLFTFENHNIIEKITTSNFKNRLIWYWYHVNGKDIANPIIAKLFQAQELISGKVSSSLIVLSTECNSQCSNKKLTLTDFLEKHHNQIIDSLSM